MKCPRCKLEESPDIVWQNGYPVPCYCKKCAKELREIYEKVNKN